MSMRNYEDWEEEISLNTEFIALKIYMKEPKRVVKCTNGNKVPSLTQTLAASSKTRHGILKKK